MPLNETAEDKQKRLMSDPSALKQFRDNQYQEISPEEKNMAGIKALIASHSGPDANDAQKSMAAFAAKKYGVNDAEVSAIIDPPDAPPEFSLPDKSHEWYQEKINYLSVLNDAIKHGEYETEIAVEHIAKCGMTKTLLRTAVSKIKKKSRNANWVNVDMKGNPKPTSSNLEVLLNMYGIGLSMNTMSHELEVSGLTFNDASVEDAIITRLEDLAVQHDMQHQRIKTMVKHLAYRNVYHPFDKYLNQLSAWDGKDRIREILQSLSMGDSSEKYFNDSLMLFKKWLLQFVAAIRRGKNQPPVRLTLIFSGAQHIGKTTFFRNLVPDDSLFLEGHDLNPAVRDSVATTIKYLLTELGEIDSTFSKREVSLLKAFLSKEKDEMRLPYDRGNTKHTRRTVFCGTVNDSQFLVDQTGNSRFAVIDVSAIDWSAGNIVDRDQLWAQVLQMFNDGVSWSLNSEELAILNERNKYHTEKPYAYTLVAERFVWGSDKSTWEWKTISDIAYGIGLDDALIRNTRAQKDLRAALQDYCEFKDDARKRTPVYKAPKFKNPRY